MENKQTTQPIDNQQLDEKLKEYKQISKELQKQEVQLNKFKSQKKESESKLEKLTIELNQLLAERKLERYECKTGILEVKDSSPSVQLPADKTDKECLAMLEKAKLKSMIRFTPAINREAIREEIKTVGKSCKKLLKLGFKFGTVKTLGIKI